MNRNYKVIWNDALQCFTAVAENAKANGKSSKSSVSSNASSASANKLTAGAYSLRLSALRSGLFAVGLTGLAIGMSSQAIAAVGVSGGIGNGTAVSNSECTNVSQANSGTNKENIAIGCASSTDDIGYQIADRGNPYYTNNVANASTVDANATQAYTPERMNAGSVAIGTGARTEGALGLAIGEYAKTTGTAGVAIGVGSLSEGNTALAIGRQSVATGNYSQAMGNVAAATGTGSLAVGHSATATGYRGIAIGSADIENASTVSGQQGAAYQSVQQTKASGRDSIALGSGAQATTEGSVAIGTNSNTLANANSVTSATINGVTFGNFAGATNIAAGDQVSVGAAGQERQVKNVAAGNVTATSTDAINGSQLFSVADTLNTDITDNRNNITNNTTNITNNTTSINQGINFGNGVTANNFVLGATIAVTGDGNITPVTTANGVQLQLNRDLALDSVTTGNTLVNNDGVILTGGSNQTIRLSNNGLNNGGNKITNVARATDGTDAVNFDQLNEVRNSAAAKSTVTQGKNIVVTSTANEDGSTNYQVATADELDVTSVTAGNSTLNNEGLGIDDGTGNTATVTASGTTVTNAAGDSTSYGANGFTASDNAGNSTVVNQTGVSFTNSDGATGPSITAGGINAGGTVITNVASGGDIATNAANIGDIQAAAAGSRTEVAAGTNITNVVKTTGENGQDIYTVNANGASVSGSSAVTVTAGNKNAANVTDYAVDLSQASKDSLVKADSAMQTVVTQIDGNNVKTVNQANNTANFVTGNNIVLSNDNGGIRVATAENIVVTSIKAGNTTLDSNGLDNGGNTITNVAAGVNPTDAVNVSQLDTVDRAINGELVTIDRNVNNLGYRIGEVEDNANAGISAAMAMSSLPQAYIAGKSMVGGGIASYNGESAVAIGVSRVSDNGRWVMKINGTADTQGNAGGAIGAGFHF
ncbi:YadA-like family protein [Psychrobacter sp. S1-30-MNA-CIBAN-0213]|uniref:YadA family autotransporter adhesin n=1 Tax=unclassified Psychrobacter TaxID=196806 RepID=UPI00332EC544